MTMAFLTSEQAWGMCGARPNAQSVVMLMPEDRQLKAGPAQALWRTKFMGWMSDCAIYISAAPRSFCAIQECRCRAPRRVKVHGLSMIFIVVDVVDEE